MAKAKSGNKGSQASKAKSADDDAPAPSAAGDDDEEEEKAEEADAEAEEAASGADLASALAAELSGLKEKDEAAAGRATTAEGTRGKKKKGLRFHALGLPGLLFVSGAGAAAINAAAAEEEENAAGAGGAEAAAAAEASSTSSTSSFNPSPSEVAQSLCSRVRAEGAGTTRFCLRLLPADDVVFVGGGSVAKVGGENEKEVDAAGAAASASEASKAAAVAAAARAITAGLRPLLAPHFRVPSSEGGEKDKPLPPPAKTFAVAYEKRASTASLERQLVIDAAMAALPARKEGDEADEIKVDLDAPDATALIQVVKGAAALGVVRDYRGLLKLNLRELAAPGSTAAADNARRRVTGGGSAGKKKEEKEEEGEKE